MEDSEIAKALECCGSPCNFCVECPMPNDIKDDCKCGEILANNALDLINRLQAENSNLTSDLTSLQNDLSSLQAENERLKAPTNDWLVKGIPKEQLEKEKIQALMDIAKKYAKVEAYKEFAELLHCQCESIINQPHNENVRPISWKVAYEEFDEKVDNLLKELVGENNES